MWRLYFAQNTNYLRIDIFKIATVISLLTIRLLEWVTLIFQLLFQIKSGGKLLNIGQRKQASTELALIFWTLSNASGWTETALCETYCKAIREGVQTASLMGFYKCEINLTIFFVNPPNPVYQVAQSGPVQLVVTTLLSEEIKHHGKHWLNWYCSNQEQVHDSYPKCQQGTTPQHSLEYWITWGYSFAVKLFLITVTIY